MWQYERVIEQKRKNWKGSQNSTLWKSKLKVWDLNWPWWPQWLCVHWVPCQKKSRTALWKSACWLATFPSVHYKMSLFGSIPPLCRYIGWISEPGVFFHDALLRPPTGVASFWGAARASGTDPWPRKRRRSSSHFSASDIEWILDTNERK